MTGKRLLFRPALNRSIVMASLRLATAEGAELALHLWVERFRTASPSSRPSSGSDLIFDMDVSDDVARRPRLRGALEDLAKIDGFVCTPSVLPSRSHRRRLPGRPVPRILPHRPRHLGLQSFPAVMAALP